LLSGGFAAATVQRAAQPRHPISSMGSVVGPPQLGTIVLSPRSSRGSREEFMCPPKPLDRPSRVAAEGGEVLVDGPNGIAISLTPEAARETSQRLAEGAAQAIGQKSDGERPTPRPGPTSG
jgi:hypothetical protein